MAKVRICETMVRPRLVEVNSESKEGVTWTVIPSTIFNDSLCDCPAWQFSKPKWEPAHCKHTDKADEERCHWMVPLDVHSEKLQSCPVCNEPAVTFNPEPEFDEER